MSKRKVELDVVLPSDAAQCAACTKRLLASVSGLPGVKSAHIDVDDATHPKLCLHYEPSSVRLSDLESLVEAAGAALRGRYAHLSTPAVGLRHEHEFRHSSVSIWLPSSHSSSTSSTTPLPHFGFGAQHSACTNFSLQP